MLNLSWKTIKQP